MSSYAARWLQQPWSVFREWSKEFNALPISVSNFVAGQRIEAYREDHEQVEVQPHSWRSVLLW
ncbi:hypothetical protein [Streptomyces sp. 3211]|uniref:hypothetical protein n=1 Tax=Streptomyces sp. 3211 TaxID=1964449 RepID=UPI001331C0D9|nr:hypothetical protein [Streptomyces sp. 3211]